MKEKLKIALIKTGNVEIPPKGWGAVEKVVWNYKINLEKLGHTVDLIFPWEVTDEYDIVHGHLENQCETIKSRGFNYVFSLHDHHVVLNKEVLKRNLRCIKDSIVSIAHAEYLVDREFESTDKLFYLEHGVDTKKYIDKGIEHDEHKLLCVASNGLLNDPSHDRKGFSYAIEAAMKLDLPISVIGPKNRDFFKRYSHLESYDKLTVLDNISEEELIDAYNNHTIFLHPSDLEAGHPNLTLLESLSCGTPVVGTYNGTNKLKGMVICERSVDDVVDKIKYTIKNYDELKKDAKEGILDYDWSVIVNKLEQFYFNVFHIKDEFDNNLVKERVIDAYINTNKNYKNPLLPKIDIVVDYKDGVKLEILSSIQDANRSFSVDFIDMDNGEVLYNLNMGVNQWASPNRKWYTNWSVNIKEINGNVDERISMDISNKKVFILLDSKSLGDTIAWFPYIEEFRLNHKCEVIACTFHNYLFKNVYPELKFIEPGENPDSDVNYKIGWFSPPWGGDRNLNPNDYRLIPLQKTSSDILGLNYKEIRPKVYLDEIKGYRPPTDKKYVCISEHSTAGAKYWNNEGGWQNLVDELKDRGFDVVVISKERTNLKGVINKTGGFDIRDRMMDISNSEFYIGVSSGLAWLAWALGKKVVMITGFTDPICEFVENNIRVQNMSVCNSCLNKPNVEFDRGDWMWCPFKKNTSEHFICSKSITHNMVMDKIIENGLI